MHQLLVGSRWQLDHRREGNRRQMNLKKIRRSPRGKANLHLEGQDPERFPKQKISSRNPQYNPRRREE